MPESSISLDLVLGLLRPHLVSVCVSMSSPAWKVHVGGCTVFSLLPSAQPWLLSAFSTLPPEATQSRAQCEPRCPTQLIGSQELHVRNCRAEDPPQVPLPSASGCSVYCPPLLFCRCDNWGPTICVKARSYLWPEALLILIQLI